MEDFALGFVVGVVMAWVITTFIFDLAPEGIVEACQAELPRNQYCELIAVPKEVDSK